MPRDHASHGEGRHDLVPPHRARCRRSRRHAPQRPLPRGGGQPAQHEALPCLPQGDAEVRRGHQGHGHLPRGRAGTTRPSAPRATSPRRTCTRCSSCPGRRASAQRSPPFLPLGTSPGFEGKVVCTTCHFIHAADTKHALLRGFPGSQEPGSFRKWQDFCRDCHGEGLEKRSPHAGDDRACSLLPREQAAGGQARRGPRPRRRPLQLLPRRRAGRALREGQPLPGRGPLLHLPRPAPRARERRPAEQGVPRGRARRDNRQPPLPRPRPLLGLPRGDGRPHGAAPPGARLLCNRCHGTGEIVGDIHPVRKVPESITPPAGWPLQKGFLTCLTCHTAGHKEHASDWKFLRGGPYADRNDFCRNCHAPDSFKGRNPHLDINEGKGCEFCHAVPARPGEGHDRDGTLHRGPEHPLSALPRREAHPAGVEHTMVVEAGAGRVVPEGAAGLPGHEDRLRHLPQPAHRGGREQEASDGRRRDHVLLRLPQVVAAGRGGGCGLTSAARTGQMIRPARTDTMGFQGNAPLAWLQGGGRCE